MKNSGINDEFSYDNQNRLAGFTYNGDGDRARMYVTSNGSLLVDRYYLGGGYEVDIKADGVTERLYLGGDAYSAPAVYMKNPGENWNIYYICRDYLGSIVAITNSGGLLVEELSYDAWGRLRDPETQEVYAPGGEPALMLGRGYTGHEHLAMFGLVNMNARLYDPALGRFLSPDPYVQSPDFSQNFNRYAYGLNNPMKYSDPDGEFWHIIIGAAIGGVINLVSNWNNIEGFWDGFAVFGAGAGSGALTAAFGPLGALGGGALAGATNNLVAQTGKNFSGFNNVNWGQVEFNAGVGGVAGIVGYGTGQWAANSLGGAVINGFQIHANSALGGALTGAVGGAAGGYAGGFTGGLIMTGDFALAHKAGVSGMKMGAGIGAGVGAVGGYISAKKAGLNPWTGKSLNEQLNSPKWSYGDHKSQTKWENQMKQRGWTEQQINESILLGKSYPAPNNINPNNGATRYVNPTTGRSVVIDNVNGKILHIGGDGFKY